MAWPSDSATASDMSERYRGAKTERASGPALAMLKGRVVFSNHAGAVTKLRLKPPSKTEPRRSERIFVTRRPFGPQLRQLLKPKTCLNRTDIGFRRCLERV